MWPSSSWLKHFRQGPVQAPAGKLFCVLLASCEEIMMGIVDIGTGPLAGRGVRFSLPFLSLSLTSS